MVQSERQNDGPSMVTQKEATAPSSPQKRSQPTPTAREQKTQRSLHKDFSSTMTPQRYPDETRPVSLAGIRAQAAPPTTCFSTVSPTHSVALLKRNERFGLAFSKRTIGDRRQTTCTSTARIVGQSRECCQQNK